MRKNLTTLSFVLVLLASLSGFAQEENPPPPSYFTVNFAGGMLFPSGDMADANDNSWNFAARLGWTATSGLGFVASAEWAPLKMAVDADAHNVFVGAGPRFTMGYSTLRPWVAVQGGALISRVKIGSADVDTETDFIMSGLLGLDVHFFSNGGLSLTGGYANNFDDKAYFTAMAGLVFTL